MGSLDANRLTEEEKRCFKGSIDAYESLKCVIPLADSISPRYSKFNMDNSCRADIIRKWSSNTTQYLALSHLNGKPARVSMLAH